MVTIISLILIFISLIIILAIVIKKFPALAILDVENIKMEKEAKFKDKIIRDRLDRDLARVSGFFGRFFLKVNLYLSKVIQKTHDNLKKIKISHEAKKQVPHQKKEKRLKDLILEAEEFVKEEKFGEAEEKLVEVISLDQKNLAAFFDLGSVYEELRKYPEARQTYEYALKLAKTQLKDTGHNSEVSLQEIYFALSCLEEKAGNIDASYDNILEALELEPSSPRYLDLILDLSIIKKDKASAWQYLNRLSESNPQNQKLEERRREIEEIEEAEE